MPTRNERSDEAINIADRLSRIERPKLRDQFLAHNRNAMVRHIFPPRRVKPFQNPPSLFVHAQRMSTVRARAFLSLPPPPPSCVRAEPYHLCVLDALYNDVGTIERDRSSMGISQAPRVGLTSSGC